MKAAVMLLPLLGLVRVVDGGITVEDPTGKIVERKDMGDPNLPPVVLVPGIGGSRIQARVPGRRNDWECLVQQFFQKSWFDLWFDITEIIPGSVGCFQANMELKWDMWRHEYLDNGVQTRLVDFGDIGGVRCIVPAMESTCTLTEVYSKLAYHLETMGYVAGSNLHGAPYDWRTGPKYWTKAGGAFSQLQRLIESTVQLNSGRKAVLVAASEGAPYLLWFLNNYVTPEWKEKYVEAYVPIAGSFGGSLQSLRMVLAGYLWGINSKSLPWIDGSILAEVSRTFGGVTWSFPQAIPGHLDDWTVVETPHRSWRASEINELLHQVDLHTTADIYNTTRRYHTFAPPGVKTYCFYGAGVSTPATLRYSSEDVYDPAMLQYNEADGDGAVMLESLNMCDVWAEADPAMYTVVRLTNATHIQTIHRAEKYILGIANGTISQMLRKLGADLIKVEDAPEAAPGARPTAPHATEGDSLTPYVQLATVAAAAVGLLLVAAPSALALLSAGVSAARGRARERAHQHHRRVAERVRCCEHMWYTYCRMSAQLSGRRCPYSKMSL
eukprot:CAMPEP_0119406352 /NCGR_PEP_ID=MMETSP1335-20130426/709_1 /TAXON_ID=259385 /ORGANISM="Chrysoculter rhomboideus, Strain RCC1486" /LENGTH=552 /DNA_ID=CAMNT_0007430429 /DNA_START=42 /DNA_END=1701 /DNA_ORIENTATION=+